MKSRIVYIILCLLLTTISLAQHRFNNPTDITLEDGLPHNWVYDFEEDQYGFIWIGTYGGLCRYDGTNVLVLKKNEQDSTGLPGDRIRSLLRIGDTLWIGTYDGAAYMNLITGVIHDFPIIIKEAEFTQDKRFSKAVRGMYKDRQGNIWMAPAFGGFLKVNPITHITTRYALDVSDQIPAVHSRMDQTSLLEITQDVNKDSIFWGISNADLVKLNIQTGKIERFRYNNKDNELEYNLNRYLCMYQHSDGNIYLGVRNRGLIIFNPDSKKYFIPFLDAPQGWLQELNAVNLRNITPINEKELYLTFSSGIYLYNIEEKNVKPIKRNITNSLQTEMYGIDFIDSEGRIWGAVDHGVRVINPLTNQYDHFSLDHLNTTDNRLLPRDAIEDFYPGYITVVGQYADGIYHINPVTGRSFKNSISKTIAEKHKYVHSWGFLQINENELVISETRQLLYYKKGMKYIESYVLQPNQEYGSLVNMTLDHNKNLWIGSSRDNVWDLNLHHKTIEKRFTQLVGGKFVNIFNDTRNNIWGVIEQGHAVLPAGARELKLFEVTQDANITFITGENFCECPDGEIWQAGNEDGLGLLSSKYPEKGIIKKIILQDSVRTYIAFRVACDRYNNLWALDNNYLLKINKKDWKITPYNFKYGIDNINGLFKILKNGNLLVGTRGGIYIINPNELIINVKAPMPYVCNIKTNQGDKQMLTAYLQSIPLQLRPKENTITIEFAAINFTLPQTTQFRYRLLETEETWNDPGKNRSITYSNLKGGNYTFQLKAANNEGIWSDKIYELPIIIGTPWYKTTIFYIMIGALVAALVYAIYRYRVSEIRREERLRTDFEKQIANIEMNALRAQMNPHFIFNCLNSIDRYIITNNTKKASEYLNHFGRLIRLILQNSRNNYINLKDELEALELYLKLEQMRFRHSFDYEINIPSDINPENYEIPPMLIQPYVENAIWHGLNHKDEKGKVSICASIKNDIITFIIEDNGIGRVASKAMMKAKEIKRQSMGMNITSERISIINKLHDTNNYVEIIDLYDKENKPSGTKVILNISL